jgi:hypothetical protein
MPIYSCHLFSNSLSPEIIKIIGIMANGDLDLKDAGNKPAIIFEVKAGKTINWLVNTPDVKNIDSIYKKPTTTSDFIFKTGPSRIGNSKNWTATVDSTATPGQFEDYNIDWTDKDDNKHTFDPRIQVKS